MSKRTQSIRSMFAAPEEAASLDARPIARVTSGAVRSLKDTFSDVERQYEALREQLAKGTVAIELDPETIDPSPFADRFEEQDPSADASLTQSIAESGQEIPILVREHPAKPGRYQSAYGHRRIRVTRALGIKIKAYVRELTDEDLVVAQGIENSGREDLSFIERAAFALTLEEGGFQRSLIQSALSVDRTEVSKLIAVAKAVPKDLQQAIGRAPKVGRPRWLALADAIADTKALARVRKLALTDGFLSAHTNDRLALVLAAAKKVEGVGAATSEPVSIRSSGGAEIARVVRSAKRSRIEITEDAEFVDFLVSKLPELHRSYRNERRSANQD
ncbi:plasmid partitioning protein RepB [Mesorhizobium loti]|uniref:Plasmid partitioning protein RepB n=1 Tax=Rhizobium loti TaxID=381 RepID=A0A101KP14_RHILI|nr:plasmid partitioning protein RepB [Mesorhizobium loti]